MIASVLTAAGYRTGLYTSPHLHTLRERVQVDGQLIAEAAVASLVERLSRLVGMDVIHRDSSYGQLTTFEVLTALAFLHFREQRASFQVVEAGLGGRLDATNVVRPTVAVVTPISYDHMDILGHTLAEIATQKAGIIKPGAAVVVGPQPGEALEVLLARCQETGVTPILVGQDVRWAPGAFGLTGQDGNIMGRLRKYGVHIPLLGQHQLENAAVAVACLEALQEQGVTIGGLALRQGLASVRWHGRLEVLGERPWLIVDGAHNGDSAKRLREAIEDYFPARKVVLVMGASRDKDMSAIARELAPVAQAVVVTQSRNPRAASGENLAAVWADLGYGALKTASVPGAVEEGRALAGAQGVVLVTGSLFVVAEAREHVLGLLSEDACGTPP